MPARDIAFELLEHTPAVDVRQEDVERERGRLILARERKRRGAERSDEPLESMLTRRIEHEPRKSEIVFDDQQDFVAGFDDIPIVVRDIRDGGGIHRRQWI